MDVTKVVVIGGGTMGSGIAEVCAKSGVDTVLLEANAEYAETAEQRVKSSLDRAVARQKISEDERKAAEANLRFTTDPGDLADRDLAIEAIVEDEQAKLELFAVLDSIVPAHAILASNTSSIPLVNLATATNRPTQVVGMHFFNPATVQPLVELVRPLTASESTVNTAASFAVDTLNKTVIHAEDRAGFIVNRLLVPYLTAAINLLDTSSIKAEDIDRGMVLGCAHPMGPLALCDLIGLDVIEAVADVLYAEFADPFYTAPPLLRRMVAANMLGVKTGQGFYSYNKD